MIAPSKLVVFGGILVSVGISLLVLISYFGSTQKLYEVCTTNFEALDFIFGLGLKTHCSMILNFETISLVLAGIGALLIVRFSFAVYRKKKIPASSKIKN